MIKIAFCDDDLSVLNDLSVLLDRYRVERNCEIEYTAYQSPFELMATIERGIRWDILLLDVLMPGESGMDLASEIRSYDGQVKIIFLTSSPEFAVQSYMVGAFFYQLKPITSESFFPVMDRAVDACAASRSENLVLRCKTGITAIPPEKLEYCEVIGRTLHLHLQNGKTLESTGKLDELESKLAPLSSFLRVHRSYLVNLAYIQSISPRVLTLTCSAEIPIPHGKHNEIKKAYLAYAFEKERVLL